MAYKNSLYHPPVNVLTVFSRAPSAIFFSSLLNAYTYSCTTEGKISQIEYAVFVMQSGE